MRSNALKETMQIPYISIRLLQKTSENFGEKKLRIIYGLNGCLLLSPQIKSHLFSKETHLEKINNKNPGKNQFSPLVVPHPTISGQGPLVSYRPPGQIGGKRYFSEGAPWCAPQN